MVPKTLSIYLNYQFHCCFLIFFPTFFAEEKTTGEKIFLDKNGTKKTRSSQNADCRFYGNFFAVYLEHKSNFVTKVKSRMKQSVVVGPPNSGFFFRFDLESEISIF